MKDTVVMDIAGVRFHQECEPGLAFLAPGPVIAPFCSGQARKGKPDVLVRFFSGRAEALEGARVLFDSGVSWSMLETGHGYRIVLGQGAPEGILWTADADHGFARVRVHTGGKEPVLPMGYPLDQILMMHVLARRQGAILHAAGVLAGDRVYLLAGKSGAGKSTVSRLLAREPGLKVLGDDRIILRWAEDGYTAHGTPWPGEGGIAAPDKGRLAGIFFLEQSGNDQVLPLKEARAMERMVPIASIPWYMASDTERTLATCHGICRGVPAFVLRFQKGAGLIKVLKPYLEDRDRIPVRERIGLERPVCEKQLV